MLARDKAGEIFGLLLIIAPAADLIDTQVGMRAIGKPERGARPADFLNRDDMLQIAEAQSAISLVNSHSVKAQSAHLRP